MLLSALSERIQRAIPLTQHLGFELLSFADQQLVLRAPLSPNINDKGTFFAGSQSALLTLAGWGLTTLLAEHDGSQQDVVAVTSTVTFRLPLYDDIHIHAVADSQEIDTFQQTLAQKHRAKLRVLAQGTDAKGNVVCEYEGLYLARTHTGTSA